MYYPLLLLIWLNFYLLQHCVKLLDEMGHMIFLGDMGLDEMAICKTTGMY